MGRVNVIQCLNVSDEVINEIREETVKDASLKMLRTYIQEGWPRYIHDVPDEIKVYFKFKSELSLQDDLIIRNDRIVIPRSLRSTMLNKVYAAHGGIEATLKLARENIFWPGMSGAIRDSVKECDICQEFTDKQSNPPMQTHEIPSARFQTVSMDLFSATHKGKKRNFVVTSDHFSDFFELDLHLLVRDLSTKSLIAITKQNFARHGIPIKIISDNSTNFDSPEFRQFAKSWGVLHITSSLHHQQGNDKAEAAVKIAKKIIKKCEKSGEDL